MGTNLLMKKEKLGEKEAHYQIPGCDGCLMKELVLAADSGLRRPNEYHRADRWHSDLSMFD